MHHGVIGFKGSGRATPKLATSTVRAFSIRCALYGRKVEHLEAVRDSEDRTEAMEIIRSIAACLGARQAFVALDAHLAEERLVAAILRLFGHQANVIRRRVGNSRRRSFAVGRALINKGLVIPRS
jgi:hypothetical protein